MNVPLCPFHAVTGLWCPLCGSLRGLELLGDGQMLAALGSNLLLVVTLPVLAWGAVALAGGGAVSGPWIVPRRRVDRLGRVRAALHDHPQPALGRRPRALGVRSGRRGADGLGDHRGEGGGAGTGEVQTVTTREATGVRAPQPVPVGEHDGRIPLGRGEDLAVHIGA